MQIYFHSGVSSGVQDLPGNNIHYGHPVEKKEKKNENKKTGGFALFSHLYCLTVQCLYTK